jgi:hypothetical protein
MTSKYNSLQLLRSLRQLLFSFQSRWHNFESNDSRNFLLRPNFALTSTQFFLVAAESANPQLSTNQTEARRFNLREAKGTALIAPLPDPGKTFMIYTAIEILQHLNQIPHGFINHTSWEPQKRPLISLDRETWNAHQLVPWTGPEPVWVELTINNLDSNGHPFHLVTTPPFRSES